MEESEEGVTVAELIAKLQAMPQDAIVYTPDPYDRFPNPDEIHCVDLWDDAFTPGVYLF